MTEVAQNGPIAPEHDLVHTPGPDPRWRESYYFSFYDPQKGIGGFSSIGKRPSKGHAGFIQCIWGPDRPTLVSIDGDTFAQHDNSHAVAGLTYRCEEPFARWSVGFEGTLNDGGADIVCAPEAVSPPGNPAFPQRAVAMDLEFIPSCPPYYYHLAADDPRWRELFDGHIDMVGRMTGTVTIDGESIEIDAVAGNDHSWGVRNWFAPDEWRWADIVMEGDLNATFWRARLGDEWFGDGALYTPSTASVLERYDERVSTVRRGEKDLVTAIDLDLAAGGSERTLHAEVRRAVPVLFNRTVDGRDLVSWNDRSLVEVTDTTTGATGWGTVEFEARLERGQG